MRILLALAVAFVLVLPVVAVADGSGSGSPDAEAPRATGVTRTAAQRPTGADAATLQQRRRAATRTVKASLSTALAAAARVGSIKPVTSRAVTRSSGVDDDEIEVKGPLTSVTPPTVGQVSCVVPAGMSIAGVQVGDVVEMTCDLIGGVWTLRKLRLEDEPDDDEIEVKGPLASVTPPTVGQVSCVVPAGMSIAGVQVGDVVEMTCDLIGGVWTLRKLQLEDARDEDDDDENGGNPGVGDNDDNDDHSRPGHGDGDDDHDNSGPGNGDGDDDDHISGPLNGDDHDDDDNSGPGHGGDDDDDDHDDDQSGSGNGDEDDSGSGSGGGGGDDD